MFTCPQCHRKDGLCPDCQDAGHVVVKDDWLEHRPPEPSARGGRPPLQWGITGIPGGVVADWDMEAGRFVAVGGNDRAADVHRYAWLELTLACPHRCRHCFVGERLGSGHADLADVRQALAQLPDFHVEEIVLAGGEPTMHPEFVAALELARRAVPLVRVLTNGWTQTPRIVTALAQSGVKVEVPLLGWGEDHDWMTRTPRSFQRIVASLRQYRDAGVDLQLTTTLTRVGIAALPQFQRLADELGIPFQPSQLMRLGTAEEFWEQLVPEEAVSRAV